MRFFLGVTDYDWFRFLASRPDIDEVNFWQPSGGVPFKALLPGELFLFKLHSPRNFIVGGGFFAHWSQLPVSLAWEVFGPKNGAATLEEIRVRLAKYRDVRNDPRADYQIGCILLEQPFFLPEAHWIPAPVDWKRNIVRGKGYDDRDAEGQRVLADLGRLSVFGLASEARIVPETTPVAAARFGKPTTILPRLGQGSFRVLVTDLYERRCTITGEQTLPVLQAAHIRPYGQDGHTIRAMASCCEATSTRCSTAGMSP
jgi:putative restriction endonuclease